MKSKSYFLPSPSYVPEVHFQRSHTHAHHDRFPELGAHRSRTFGCGCGLERTSHGIRRCADVRNVSLPHHRFGCSLQSSGMLEVLLLQVVTDPSSFRKPSSEGFFRGKISQTVHRSGVTSHRARFFGSSVLPCRGRMHTDDRDRIPERLQTLERNLGIVGPRQKPSSS